MHAAAVEIRGQKSDSLSAIATNETTKPARDQHGSHIRSS
jgi:hypothetical protein